MKRDSRFFNASETGIRNNSRRYGRLRWRSRIRDRCLLLGYWGGNLGRLPSPVLSRFKWFRDYGLLFHRNELGGAETCSKRTEHWICFLWSFLRSHG